MGLRAKGLSMGKRGKIVLALYTIYKPQQCGPVFFSTLINTDMFQFFCKDLVSFQL